jgi:type VI secretion system protein ImpF
VANPDREARVVLSVLDRLVDLEPDNAQEELSSRRLSYPQFRRQVQRDLEQLLNTRNAFFDLPSEFEEVGQSVIAYGLPDFSIVRRQDEPRLCLAVKDAIERFEPRLREVVVTLIPSSPPNDRTLKLRIDAKLLIDPAPEPVAFDIATQFQRVLEKKDEHDRG